MSSSSRPSTINTPLFSNSPASTRTSSMASSLSKSQHPPLPLAPLPTTQLNVTFVSNVLAARLCMAMLEHTLYLNGQIPFPVQGLPGLNLEGKAHAKASKKRDDLLSTLDLLSSHLPSTFQCLSWALSSNPNILRTGRRSTTQPVHVVLVTGPSPSTAKARCLLEIQDFIVARYGERIPTVSLLQPTTPAMREEFRIAADVRSTDGDQTPTETGRREKKSPRKTPTSSRKSEWQELRKVVETRDYDSEEEDGAYNMSFGSFVSGISNALSSIARGEISFDDSLSSSNSMSRESSPIRSSKKERRSDRERDRDRERERESEREKDRESRRHGGSSRSTTDHRSSRRREERSGTLSPKPRRTAASPPQSPPRVPPPSEEEILATNVRQLSLTMASSFDFGREDIPVTQTHVLLRAPRCFKHPSWLPKQNISKALDTRVSEFFESRHSGSLNGSLNGSPTRARKGPLEEGLRVLCPQDPNTKPRHDSTSRRRSRDGYYGFSSPLQEPLPEEPEADDGSHELIWWQWSSGSIRGFGDL
ncbi:hypothetical protein FRB99_000036 [Tulasnella sp. 403]|nr:hypothetical protein FRB99_000036 [Tulasnella sp. 403]